MGKTYVHSNSPIATARRKEEMVEALIKNRGLITYACKQSGVSRSQFWTWKQKDPEFAALVQEVNNFNLDYVENKMYDMIEDKIPAVVIFYLKTRGRDRGYIEKHEIEHSIGNIEKVRELVNDIDENDRRDY